MGDGEKSAWINTKPIPAATIRSSPPTERIFIAPLQASIYGRLTVSRSAASGVSVNFHQAKSMRADCRLHRGVKAVFD
jgi:hypothetical protein